MVSIIISECLFLAIINWWPLTPVQKDENRYFAPKQEVFVEEIINTEQETAPARPPRPQIPIPIPSDQIIEEDFFELDLEEVLSLESISDMEAGQEGESDQIVGNPDTKPSLLKIVEPSTPLEARRAGIKAEVYITFLVNRTGGVEDVYISKIVVYDSKGGSPKVVNQVGYGLMEVAMEAAASWKFKPAKDNGKAVKSYTTQIFSFGF